MRLPRHTANPGLAVLIIGAGYPSWERFGVAVNEWAWHRYGMKVYYDHLSVRRWLRGGLCRYPDVVAQVLSEAWGLDLPIGVLWPTLRNGGGPIPAHCQAWAADRTLADLGSFLRSDMLSRREALTSAVAMVSGAALVDPIVRWLATPAPGLAARVAGAERVSLPTVLAIEQATQRLQAVDAMLGGGLARDSSIGLLKHAVDMAEHASYPEAVGSRLLAAIANLSGRIAWMSFDQGMAGPAQTYLLYSIQAARESGHERASTLTSRSLSELASLMSSSGDLAAAVRLVNLALDQLPPDRRRFNGLRANLWSTKARLTAGLGADCHLEVRSALGLSYDLLGQVSDDDPELAELWPYVGESEVASNATIAYRQLAAEDRAFAGQAEAAALRALALRDAAFTRSRVFDHIALARVRFLMGEPDQACADGAAAIAVAGTVLASRRVVERLRDLETDSEPYRDRPAVRDLHERLLPVGAVDGRGVDGRGVVGTGGPDMLMRPTSPAM